MLDALWGVLNCAALADIEFFPGAVNQAFDGYLRFVFMADFAFHKRVEL